MSELEQAARQALEAVEDLRGYRQDIDEAITALRAALEHPAAPAVPDAVAVILDAIRTDPDYAWSWHCNIAMGFVDAGGDTYTANQGAARFMRTLAQVEPTHPLPKTPAVEQQEAPAAVAQQTPPQQDTAAYNGWVVRDVLFNDGEPVGHRAVKQEPFGYFRPEPFGWTDCAETDEGAIALYEKPQPAAPQSRQPLTNEQVQTVLSEAGYDDATLQNRADFIAGLRCGEAAHGITTPTEGTTE